MLNLTDLIDDAKCYETVRQMRWKEGVCCPQCSSAIIIKRGKDETQLHRQRYQCKNCGAHFDDLIGTIFALASSISTSVDFMFIFDGTEPVESSNPSRARPR
jgi:transposase-like protein